jgi:hypothetical protein
MNQPLSCECGALQGYVEQPEKALRARCYCRDCRAFARFLDASGRVLDSQGGTHVVAVVPQRLHFTRGREHLRCMSLSDRGLLRWYAACCRAPIGNTPRDAKISYVGLIDTCLPGLSADRGSVRVAVQTKSAQGKVEYSRFALLLGTLRIMGRVMAARLGGGYRQNPFFRPGTDEPVVAPQVVSPTEREALRAA